MDPFAEPTQTALVCLSGLDSDEFIAHALRRLHQPAWRLVLLYVIDVRPQEELGYLRQGLFRGRLTAEQVAQMTGAEDTTAREVVEEARQQVIAAGWLAPAVLAEVRRGRPEQEIIARARSGDISLILIGNRYKGGSHPAIGPASVGHVARFVLDHAPCDVLLLR
jgi:nucleotide-binding universal stress UspA family protein